MNDCAMLLQNFLLSIQIGPWLYHDNLNGELYNEFLTETLPLLLDEAGVPRRLRPLLWFQQDGAPPHRTDDNLDEIRDRFGHRYIGPRALPPECPWTPRSPDLTPLDFFAWGLIKGEVFKTDIDTLEDLEARIVVATECITPEMLQNCRRNLIARLRCCIDQHGEHVEHLFVNQEFIASDTPKIMINICTVVQEILL